MRRNRSFLTIDPRPPEIAFRDIGAELGRDLAQLAHRIGDYHGLAAAPRRVRAHGRGCRDRRRANAADQRQPKALSTAGLVAVLATRLLRR